MLELGEVALNQALVRALVTARRLATPFRSQGKAWLDRIPLLLSLGAFAMSGFTFYDQYLRKDVELWMQVVSMEIEYRDANEGYFPHLEAVFTNRGHVPGVVFAIRSHQVVNASSNTDCVTGQRSDKEEWLAVKSVTIGSTNLSGAIIVKPNEPLAARIMFQRFRPVGDPIAGGFCLAVSFLSASGSAQQARIWLRAPLGLEAVSPLAPEPVRLKDNMFSIVRGGGAS